MTSNETTPAVEFRDPPKIRRRRKATGSRIFTESTREALKQRPGDWAVFHSAAYAVPTKRWKDEHPGFQFHVVNSTQRDEEGEFVGEKHYEVFGRYIGENGEYDKDDQQDSEGGSDEDFSPAAEV